MDENSMTIDWYKQRYFMARDVLWEFLRYGDIPEQRVASLILDRLKFNSPDGKTLDEECDGE